jgi:hypothetical protein
LDPKYEGSNEAQRDGISMAIKIHSTPSFGKETKPSAACCKILRNVRIPFETGNRYTLRQSSSLLLGPPELLLDDSAGRIARDLW